MGRSEDSASAALTKQAGGYDCGPVEARWQAAWAQQRAFAAPPAEDERQPAYVCVPCLQTSGEAHIGHVRSYTIADAHARFKRARGRGTLFSLGFQSLGLPSELEALRRGISPREWVEQCSGRMRALLDRLGCSCDWERTFMSSDPEQYRWTQWLFLALYERELIYRDEDAHVTWCDSCASVVTALQQDDGKCWRCQAEVRFVRRAQWFMRTSAYFGENARALQELPGWGESAIDSQRAVLGQIDGVELDASTFDGISFTVFTAHPQAISEAAFIAVSPAHPDIERFVADAEISAALADMRSYGRADSEAEEIPLLQTGVLASVPGVAGTLPVIVLALVDALLGATAVLGIPAADPTDRAIAERLPASSGGVWKAAKSGVTPRPSARHRLRDPAISRERAWGAPIPLIHCPACGIVPVPVEELPVRLPEDLEFSGEGANPLAERPDFYECACPRCDAQARRETDTIDCHVDAMWMWMPVCVPPENRSSAMFGDRELARWLPAEQLVCGVDAAGTVFDQRVLAKMLQDLGQLAQLPEREPFAHALVHELVREEGQKLSAHLRNGVDPGELLEAHGADSVRLAVLFAASPGGTCDWNEQSLQYCRSFLERLHAYAAVRLREWAPAIDGEAKIDASEKLRRRLANWCGVAREKVTGDLEQSRDAAGRPQHDAPAHPRRGFRAAHARAQRRGAAGCRPRGDRRGAAAARADARPARPAHRRGAMVAGGARCAAGERSVA